jgi:hypothetical protein
MEAKLKGGIGVYGRGSSQHCHGWVFLALQSNSINFKKWFCCRRNTTSATCGPGAGRAKDGPGPWIMSVSMTHIREHAILVLWANASTWLEYQRLRKSDIMESRLVPFLSFLSLFLVSRNRNTLYLRTRRLGLCTFRVQEFNKVHCR